MALCYGTLRCMFVYITLRDIAIHYITLYISLSIYHIALDCIISHCITLHYITLYYITLHHIALYHIISYCIRLHYITLYCIAYIAYITLHYTTLHKCSYQYTEGFNVAYLYKTFCSKILG